MQQPEIQTIELNESLNIVERYLSNGIKLECVPLEDTHIVKLNMVFPCGRWEQDSPMQAYFMINQMKEGSENTPPDMMDQKMEYYAGIVKTDSNVFGVNISLTCLDRNLPYLLPLLRELVTSPLFGKERLELMRTQELQMYDYEIQRVTYASYKLFSKNLLSEECPFARFAQREDIMSMSKEIMKPFHDKYINSSNCKMWLSCANSDAVVKVVDDVFGSTWGNSSFVHSQYTPFSGYPEISKEIRVTEHVGNGMQSSVEVGCFAPGLSSPDYVAFELLTYILGGYFGSRLMMNLREEKGFTYGVYSILRNIPYKTYLNISTQTDNKYVEKVVDEIKRELTRLCSERVGDDELSLAKKCLVGSRCRTFDDRMKLSGFLASLDNKGISLDDYYLSTRKMLELTSDDLLTVAQRSLNPEKLVICVAGNI